MNINIKPKSVLKYIYPLYVSEIPAKGSFPHLANKNTVFNISATEQVLIVNLIMALQLILRLETKTPLMTWPSAAAGISTSPRGKQDSSSYMKIQDIIVKQLGVQFYAKKEIKTVTYKMQSM